MLCHVFLCRSSLLMPLGFHGEIPMIFQGDPHLDHIHGGRSGARPETSGVISNKHCPDGKWKETMDILGNNFIYVIYYIDYIGFSP